MTAVEVCPICDIAECRHIRERKAQMTHPNDEELDALVEYLRDKGFISQREAAAITALRAQLAEVQARITAMESGDWSEVKLVRFENGQMDISAGPIPAIAEYLAQMIQDGEGKYFNYMEISFDHKTAGPMMLSLQRKNGKTPNQLRKEAEARADRAEASLAAQIDHASIKHIASAPEDIAVLVAPENASADDWQVSWWMTTEGRWANWNRSIPPCEWAPMPNRNQPHDRTALDRMLREAILEGMRIATFTPIEQVPSALDAAILAMIEQPKETK